MAESARQSDPRSIVRRAPPVGELLRQWRRRRGFSQLDLACEADISTRHVSFLETGRSLPSRSMVIHLAERLDIPLRERNGLLVAAGYAPIYSEHSLDDPALRAAREAVDLVLTGHEPYPALAVDRHWQGRGIGTGLMMQTKVAAVAEFGDGVRCILLSAPAAIEFYEKVGLERHPNCFDFTNLNG